MTQSVWRRAISVPILLLALWLLTDNETVEDAVSNNKGNHHHLAVWTALKRHPPSMRVFRSLLEFDLILWGTVFALFVWSRTIGSHVVGKLLFGPLKEEGINGMIHQDSQGNDRYQPVTALDDDDEDDDDEDEETEEQETFDSKNKKTNPGLEKEKLQKAQSKTRLESTPHHPPTTASVASAALDLLLLTMLSLFFFTWSSAEGGRYIDGMSTFKLVANIAAPTFPLILFCFVALVMLPWNEKRKSFWKIIFYTVSAPMYPVDFRDGFIGDVLTSSVRPMQDIAFTVFYFVSGLRGWWLESYDLDNAVDPVERSWLLLTVILPMCMVSPLWWRFLQNLRQSYDYQKRWPYLGNAAKYMVAAEVAMFGVFDPLRRQSFGWIVCFVLATLYQIWWDIFMDWGLLTWSKGAILPQLRPARAYRYRWMYWLIFVVNLVLRFGWTWSFLPARYLTQAGVLRETFDQGELRDILWPAIACAEIMRRTLWGLLRLEYEAIKTCRHEIHLHSTSPMLPHSSSSMSINERSDGDVELQPMSVAGSEVSGYSISTIGPSFPIGLNNDTSVLSKQQILTELGLWAVVFAALGMVAAAHRAIQ